MKHFAREGASALDFVFHHDTSNALVRLGAEHILGPHSGEQRFAGAASSSVPERFLRPRQVVEAQV